MAPLEYEFGKKIPLCLMGERENRGQAANACQLDGAFS